MKTLKLSKAVFLLAFLLVGLYSKANQTLLALIKRLFFIRVI